MHSRASRAEENLRYVHTKEACNGNEKLATCCWLLRLYISALGYKGLELHLQAKSWKLTPIFIFARNRNTKTLNQCFWENDSKFTIPRATFKLRNIRWRKLPFVAHSSSSVDVPLRKWFSTLWFFGEERAVAAARLRYENRGNGLQDYMPDIFP